MTDDPLFVSPYLLRPLRSYAEALRDRQQAATAPPREAPKDSGATSGPEVESAPASLGEGGSTNDIEEDFK